MVVPRTPCQRRAMQIPALFHERHGSGFRRRFRHEVSRSHHVDIAITRMRLSTIDLGEEELAGLTAIRLVLAELRAVELDAEAHALMARPRARERLRRLERLLDQDLVRVRVAPLAGWSPDFSVFSHGGRPRGVLLGFHAFELPHPFSGPAMGAHFGSAEARDALCRFEEIWARGHDVAPAIHSIFRRARRWVVDPGPPPRAPNPVDTLPALG